jgi:hypothetical protein
MHKVGSVVVAGRGSAGLYTTVLVVLRVANLTNLTNLANLS